jgi:hypothetical protein
MRYSSLETRFPIPVFTLYIGEFTGQRSRCSSLLRAGRPGDPNSVAERFSVRLQTGPGSYATSCTMGTGSTPGVKRPKRVANHPPSSSVEVTNGLELFLRLTSLPAQACHGVTITCR